MIFFRQNRILLKALQTGEDLNFYPPYALASYLGCMDALWALQSAGVPYLDNGNGIDSVLLHATKKDDFLMVEYLCGLRECVSPDEPLSANSDAFVLACFNGGGAIVEKLLTLVKKNHGYSAFLNKAITYAALGGHEQLVKSFIRTLGANINNQGFPVLDHLLNMFHPDFQGSSIYNDFIDGDIKRSHVIQALRILIPFKPKTRRDPESFNQFIHFLCISNVPEYQGIYNSFGSAHGAY